MFQGKHVVVTGGASGIGAALVARYGADGARVTILDRDETGLDRAHARAQQAGYACLTFACDLRDFDSCEQAINEAIAQHGDIDVLINNAGISQRSLIEVTSVDVIRTVMDINFMGSVHCTKAALASIIRTRGRIVALSSIAGFAPLLARSGYCASKHAMFGFFNTLRAELRPHGVSVTIACPSFTESNIERNALGGDGKNATNPRSTSGTMAKPETVADAIYRAAARRTPLLILSTQGKLARIVAALAPGLYERMMTRLFAVELHAVHHTESAD